MTPERFNSRRGLLMQAFSIISACCLCWKRKATDVVPAYLEARPFDPYRPKPKEQVHTPNSLGAIPACHISPFVTYNLRAPSTPLKGWLRVPRFCVKV